MIPPIEHLPHLVKLHLLDVDFARRARDWCAEQFGEPNVNPGGRWACFYDWTGTIRVHFRDFEDALLFSMAWK